MIKSTIYLLQDRPSQLHLQVDELGYSVKAYTDTNSFLTALADQPRNACAVLDLKTGTDDASVVQQQALADRISIPFVFVIDTANTSFAVSVVRRGAIAILERPIDREELQAALDLALMSADSYRAFAESGSHCVRLSTLTERERRIVQLAADGLPNKRIASILGLSVKTVEKQRRQAYQRLRVNSTAEMTRAVTLGNLHPLLTSAAGPAS